MIRRAKIIYKNFSWIFGLCTGTRHSDEDIAPSHVAAVVQMYFRLVF
jgi:hypothetical protein